MLESWDSWFFFLGGGGGWVVRRPWHVWCYAFGVKGITAFSRIKSLLCQISSFYFLKTPWMGIEVLHSLHVFFDGISRHYTFVPLLLLYYSWFHHFHVFLFYSCFDLLFFFDLYTSCLHFLFLINFNYLSKKKNRWGQETLTTTAFPNGTTFTDSATILTTKNNHQEKTLHLSPIP